MKHSFPSSASRHPRPFLFLLLFLVGGAGYYGMELAFRGYSHWSMALCGGLCLCLIYLANRRLRHRPLLLRALTGALIVTAVEFAAGCVLNLYLGWHVWDYSRLPFNLFGQIAPLFSALWFALCIPLCFICSSFDRTVPSR